MSEMVNEGGWSELDGFQAGRHEGLGNGRDEETPAPGNGPPPSFDRNSPGDAGGGGENARAGGLPPIRDDGMITGGNPLPPPPDRGGPPCDREKHAPEHHRH